MTTSNDKPTGRFRCLACGQEWEGRCLYRNPYSLGANVWTCGNLQCGANVVEVYGNLTDFDSADIGSTEV